jgi:hypothetical protein
VNIRIVSAFSPSNMEHCEAGGVDAIAARRTLREPPQCADKEMTMKLLLLTVLAIAVLASVPEFAAAKHRHLYRQARASVTIHGTDYRSPYAVYSAGTYVGSDPDAQARQLMLIDFNRGAAGPGNR